MKSRSFGWVVLTTSLAFVMSQLDVSIVNIALPQIGKSYNANISILQWVVDAYTLSFAVLMLSAGNLGDLLGANRIFQIGMIIFGLASVGCGLSPSGGILILCRAVQGIGAAMMIPTSLTLLNFSFNHNPGLRARAVGLWTAAGGAAIAAGPIVGGLLVKFLSWRFIFFVNVPICIIGYLLSLRLDKTNKPTEKRKFDIGGQITWTLAITALIMVIIEGPHLGFGNFLIWGGLALCIVMFCAFLFIESKTKHPMLPFHLFSSGFFNALLIFGAVLNGAYYGLAFLLSLYLQKALHYSTLQAGFAFLPLTAGFIISNMLSAPVINKYGLRLPILGGIAVFALGLCGLYIAKADTPYWQLLLPFLVIPMGMGMAIPSMTTAVLSSVEKSLSGTASAVFNTVRQTAGAIGVAVFGALAAGGSAKLLGAIPKSTTASLVVLVVIFLLVFRKLKASKAA